jgi:hypothetical protein
MGDIRKTRDIPIQSVAERNHDITFFSFASEIKKYLQNL